jgi:hypothetical protein
MCIVPVGRGVTLLASGIIPHLDYIKKQIGAGIQHFYIVSTGDLSVHSKELVEKACTECNLNLVFSEEYAGIFRGRKRKMFCALCSITTLQAT